MGGRLSTEGGEGAALRRLPSGLAAAAETERDGNARHREERRKRDRSEQNEQADLLHALHLLGLEVEVLQGLGRAAVVRRRSVDVSARRVEVALRDPRR